MKSIIVATDLSARSDRALHRALRLAAQQDAMCHVVAVVDEALPEDLGEQLVDSITERLPAQIDSLNTGARYDVTVPVGDIAEQVCRFSEDKYADLLVLGMHRKRAFLDTLRETTMERIVTASRRPVLLVRDAADHDYETALALISFSSACIAALKSVRLLAPKADVTSIHALHVPFAGLTGGQEDSAMARAVRQEAEDAASLWQDGSGLSDADLNLEIITGGVRGVLMEEVDARQPDLLAIGAHTRAGLSLHRLGGFTAELMRDPPRDLLIAPPTRR